MVNNWWRRNRINGGCRCRRNKKTRSFEEKAAIYDPTPRFESRFRFEIRTP